ncbi:MAG: hypothetical protein HZA66_03355 [Rhodopseudomonas palustris]|uniref:Uncharacterized protein n=1 Tax=Rhodopseudomonas palustris TaxID=1076 RepID=A0A933RTR8_RHOPL|nr:hypothetical protein [Rhodopseudomonas palustris]
MSNSDNGTGFRAFHPRPVRWAPLNSTVLLRSIGAGLGVALALYACSQAVAEFVRPAFRTADFFTNAKPAPDSGALAAALSFDSGILSDSAANKAKLALATAPSDQADRKEVNRDAQSAVRSALSASPVNSALWLMLGLLESSVDQPSAAALKMSYLTGRLPPEAMATRIRALITTPAAVDEEIKILAQSDLRALLSRGPSYETALTTAYRQATPEGRKFLLDTADSINPRFATSLRRSD